MINTPVKLYFVMSYYFSGYEYDVLNGHCNTFTPHIKIQRFLNTL